MTAKTIVIRLHPCIKCGACDRNNNGNCKPCYKAIKLAYRIANRDKEKANKAAWLAKNPGKGKIYSATYDAANREKRRANSAAYYVNNRDKIKVYVAAQYKAKGAAYYAANYDQIKASKDKWAKANPEAHRITKQNRRARQRENGGILSKGLADKLCKLQKGKCACCKEPLGTDYHLDHIMPIALGGLNIDSNIQLLRKACNLHKSAKHPIDFMQSRGFLL